ncbi:MAG: hypothetical protein DELT_01086 [Desulfovibrio sp.]
MPAPIIVFPYNRPEHFCRTIQSLRENDLSAVSDLYIYSDGPKDAIAAPGVASVRALCSAITGFRSVSVVEREQNLGPCESFRRGISETLLSHDSAIIFDDDTICSPQTLTYFNTCLDLYRDRPGVFSITGWCPPPTLLQITENYPYDIFFMPRNGSWGWAIWRDRWNMIDWDLHDYEQFRRQEVLVRAFAECGEDLPQMLEAQYTGSINTWDIQICYAQFKHHALTVYPVTSYTANIGLDGSGTHFKEKGSRFSSELKAVPDIPRLPEHIFVDPAIAAAFRKVYAPPPVWKRAINKIWRALFRKNLFMR